MKSNKKAVFKGNVTLNALTKLQAKGIETVTEVLVLFFVVEAAEPPTLADVTRELRMPFSTVSRILYGLHQAGFISYLNHKTDRRKKLLTADLTKLAA